MRIGLVGAGWLGGTVGRVRLKAGHEVLFSSRQREKQQRGTGLRARLGAAELRRAFERH